MSSVMQDASLAVKHCGRRLLRAPPALPQRSLLGPFSTHVDSLGMGGMQEGLKKSVSNRNRRRGNAQRPYFCCLQSSASPPASQSTLEYHDQHHIEETKLWSRQYSLTSIHRHDLALSVITDTPLVVSSI